MSTEKLDLENGLRIRNSESDVAATTDEAILRRVHEVTSYVETLVASWNGPKTVVERRRWHRIPYQRPILLTPLHDETDEPIGEAFLVQGRDISLGGVSFAHLRPLACRKVACTFDPNSGCRDSVIVRLTWCRFTTEGCYQSGGQFMQTIALKIDPAAFDGKPEFPGA